MIVEADFEDYTAVVGPTVSFTFLVGRRLDDKS